MIEDELAVDAFNSLIQRESFVLADFYADWCEPCKMLDAILVDVKNKMADKIFIQKIDIDFSKKLAIKQGIMSVPVLILFKNGIPVWRMNGFKIASELINIFEKFVSE